MRLSGRSDLYEELRRNKTVEGKESHQDLLVAYDGETTRLLDTDSVGNIHDGKFEHSFLYRPHTCLLGRARVDFRLSLYLQGGRTVTSEPSYKDVNVQTSLVGREKVNGLDCCKIKIDVWHVSERPDQASPRYLWLAIERNYLPVKTEAYEPLRNKNLPLEVATVDRFEEIARRLVSDGDIPQGLRSGRAHE